MKRLLALALAAIIGGPTCMCLAGSEEAPPPPQQHACCHAAHDADGQDAPAKSAPKAPCDCNMCLAKRNLANDAPQIPSITWTVAPFVSAIQAREFYLHEHVAWSSFLIDSGPPHERRPLFVRHCALLL